MPAEITVTLSCPVCAVRDQARFFHGSSHLRCNRCGYVWLVPAVQCYGDWFNILFLPPMPLSLSVGVATRMGK